MINPQLQLHLDTFDSDEESLDSIHVEEVVPIVPIIPAKAKRRKLFRIKPKSAVTKLFVLLPVGIAIGDFIGLTASFVLGTACLIYLQYMPDAPAGKNPPARRRRRSSIIGSEIPILQRRGSVVEKTKQRFHDCRRDVARLIGLIGGPPMEMKHKQPYEFAGDIASSATNAIFQFAQAHVRLILALDHAYHWIRLSASLHLGLGPQSQCVARVERAALAKLYRSRRRSQRGGQTDQVHIEVHPPALEPQRGVCGGDSILSLSDLRDHLAQVMVDQAESLSAVLDALPSQVSRQLAILTKMRGYMHGQGSEEAMIPLERPECVTLAWIKFSRRQLTVSLCHVLECMCTLKYMELSSICSGSGGPSSIAMSHVEESTWNARNARDYLNSMMLLQESKTYSATNADYSDDGQVQTQQQMQSPSLKDPMVQPLLQMREQLEALQGSLWACYQSAFNKKYDVNDETTLDYHSTQRELERSEWWSRVKQLSASVRAIENEIDSGFFHDVGADDALTDYHMDVSDSTSQMKNFEAGQYEHHEPNDQNPPPTAGEQSKNTTLVFSGHGAVEDRPKTKSRQGNKSTSGVSPSLQRDRITEQLMVQELQSRVQTLGCPPEEDVDQSLQNAGFINNNNSSGILTDSDRNASLPSTSHFLGASGSLLSELKGSIPNISDGSSQWEMKTEVED